MLISSLTDIASQLHPPPRPMNRQTQLKILFSLDYVQYVFFTNLVLLNNVASGSAILISSLAPSET